MPSLTPSLFVGKPNQEEEKRKKRLAEDALQADGKKKKGQQELETESKVANKYLEAENLVQNSLLIPGVASEIGKSGLIAAISGNPLAIQGFFFQEAAQSVIRNTLANVTDGLGKSMRHSLGMKSGSR